MTINELHRKVHQIIFDICVVLDEQTSDLGAKKRLEYRPGRSNLFHIVAEENGVITTTRFTAILPAIEFYIQAIPRQ